MLSLSRWQVRLGLGLIATIGVLLLSFGPRGGADSVQAGIQTPDCLDLGEILCLSLDPATGTNIVGDDHNLTATLELSVKGQPVPADLSGIPIVILVFDGPNAGPSVVANSDANGQVSLTYTGDAGPGTDTIVGMACYDLKGVPQGVGVQGQQTCNESLQSFITYCLADPTGCLDNMTQPQGDCATLSRYLCDIAEKEWVEPTPTETPPAEATATTTPTEEPMPSPTADLMADVIAPDTGAGAGHDGSPLLAWLAALAGAAAGVSAVGIWMVGRRRFTR